MAHVPIRTLTLYKQGIGYFERQGRVEGAAIGLAVPRESINDVLKSLDIVIAQGGPVLSVDYETPEDKTERLADLSIKLADRSSMVDMLVSLRGSLVTLQLEDSDPINGRVIGVETSVDPVPPTVLLQRDLQVQVIPLNLVRGLTIHDERAATDVSFLLDISRTEQTRTTLTIRLTAGSHDIDIRYVAPSPTWRVSYRLVSDGQNRARLLGWGLFENCLDEDLEDVSLTLISGRPISFEYGLYESRVPTRPQVSDDQTALERMSDNPLIRESLSTISHELRTPLTALRGYADLLDREIVGSLNEQQREMFATLRQNIHRMNTAITDLLSLVHLKDPGSELLPFLQRTGPLGDLKASGSYFLPVQMGNAEQEFLTYRVAAPVSVRRGQSAMVPIIDAQVRYQQLCIYNGAKMPNHPLLVWQMQNTTGVALEHGPVTLAEAGRYVGEGIVRFTGVGDDIHIPYALEFGILVEHKTETQPRRFWQVAFDATTRVARVSHYEVTEHYYTLTSHVHRTIQVLIEHRDPSRGVYHEMPDPDFAAEGHTRWSVVVPAQNTTSFVVREREISTIEEDITTWQDSYVEALRESGVVSTTICDMLQHLLATQQASRSIGEQKLMLRGEYNQIGALQEQFRQNLGALGDSDREITIRNRILDDLEASENRRRAIEAALIDLDQQAKQNQASQQTIVDAIYNSAVRTP